MDETALREGTEVGTPLTPLQEGILFDSLLRPDGGADVVQVVGTLRERFDPDAFRAAWARVVERHEILRTGFRWEGLPEPRQVVHSAAVPVVELLDWAGLPAAEREHRLDALVLAERRRGFDLAAPPLARFVLVRTGEAEHRFVWSWHHLILDGRAYTRVLEETFANYAALREGREPETAGRSVPFRTHARWIRSRDLTADEAFWRERLAGVRPAPLRIGRRPAAPGPGGWHNRELRRRLPEAVAARLEGIAAESGITLNTVLHGAWALLLARYGGERDVVFGATVSVRRSAPTGSEDVVGPLIATLPIRARVEGEADLLPWLRDLRGERVAMRPHEHAPLARLREWSGIPAGAPLFESVLAYESHLVATRLRALGGGWENRELRVAREPAAPLSALVFRDEGLLVVLSYRVDGFAEAAVERVLRHFCTLLEAIAADPHRPLADLPPADAAERAEVLGAWNATARDRAGDRPLHETVLAQAARTPAATAVTGPEGALTYAELAARSGAVAAALRARGIGPGARVGVCVERSAALVPALLGVMRAGAAYVPLDPAHPPARLRYVAEDAALAAVLADGVSSPRVAELGAPVLRLDGIAPAAAFPAIDVPMEAAAYLMYTSGSTGQPKGVVVPHGAVANFLASMAARPGFAAGETLVAVTTPTFDISVLELFLPLTVGGRVAVADADTATDGRRLAALLEETGAAAVQATPATWRMLLDAGWRARPGVRALCGGEALPPELAAALATAGAEVWNLYGPTETTVWSTLDPVDPAEAPTLGRPIASTAVYVVDAELRPVPVAAPGELLIGGAGVARGYHGRPALTAERFLPDPFGGEPGARLYRTGDRVRWLPCGRLDYLGRGDRQLKVRGVRVEPGEVEAALAALPGVAQAVVEAREDRGVQHLVAYLVPAGEAPEPAALRAALRERLPDAMVPTRYVLLERLPLNASGKVDRAALPAPAAASLAPGAGHVAPRTPTEAALAELWSEVLGVERPGVHDDFFDLGGHSLLAMRLLSRLRAVLHADLPLRALFDARTIEALAARVDAGGRAVAEPIPPWPAGAPAPLAFAQERLWVVDRMTPGTPLYNVPASVRLRGPLRVEALERAVLGVVGRQEALRTRFAPGDDGAVQVVDRAPAAWRIPVHDLASLPGVSRATAARRLAEEEALRPFDLAAGPLLRTALVRLAAEDHLFLLTVHHTVCDGGSLEVLFREIAAFYAAGEAGPALPALEVRYADFAAWQRTRLRGEALDAHLAYWRGELADAPAVLPLPTDRPRPAVPTHRGAALDVRLPRERVDALAALARGENATPFMVLLAAFAVVLARWSGEERIVVGTPLAGRERPELEPLVGHFATTLPLRADLAGDPSFRELVSRVREATLGAHAHQALPLEKLVEELHPERAPGQAPLFQVAFGLQGAHPRLALAGLEPAEAELRTPGARFDLTLSLREAGDEIRGTLSYATDLFDAATAERLLAHWQSALAAVIGAPGRPVSTLALAGAAERQRLLVEWNATAAPFADRPIHHLVAARAAAHPAAVAVVQGAETLTYGELDTRANRLAHALVARGARPDAPVAVHLDRTPDLVIALLAVMKSGAPYLPLDPANPPERLAWMLEDSGASILVTTAPLSASSAPPRENRSSSAPLRSVSAPLRDPSPTTLRLDTDGAEIARHPPTPPDVTVDPANLAYVVYTSGSTGTPKGVAVPHRGLANVIAWHHRTFALTPADRASQVAAPGFDAFGWEAWPALAAGAALELAPEEARLDPEALRDWLTERAVTVAFLPTPLAEAALALEWARGAKLRLLVAAGDRLHARPEPGLPFTLVNAYGPTECSIIGSWAEVEPADAPAPPPSIGRPVANTRAHVLDAHGELAPLGAPGELHLAGAGVARGYLGRPALTAERFVPDPFSPQAGGRCYRTGDRVRWTTRGELEFLGRTDQQVKVRGFRIEPGEVEAALTALPGVAEAAVVARGEGEERRLVGYVVAAEGTGGPAARELRVALRARLPEHMVPSAFVALERLPLTANGKVDRAALPPPGPRAAAEETPYAPPRTASEEALAAIWAEVLGVERVGVHDDFFQLGGHSLLAARIAARVQRRLGMEMPLAALFGAPTVAGLAARLDPDPLDTASEEALLLQLDELDGLSEEEVLALLAGAGVSLAEETR